MPSYRRVPGLGRLVQLYQVHYRNPRRERQFLVWLSFLFSVLIIRAVAIAIKMHIGPFSNFFVDGQHIHHMVLGILVLMMVGYLGVIGIAGDGRLGSKRGRLIAIGYGVGAALTLDEFSLWLNLNDVYWSPLGVESLRAMMVFAGFLAVAMYGGPLLRAIGRESGLIAKETVDQAKEEIERALTGLEEQLINDQAIAKMVPIASSENTSE